MGLETARQRRYHACGNDQLIMRLSNQSHHLPPPATRRQRFVNRVLDFGRWIVEREELPRDHEAAPVRPGGFSAIGWLGSPEPLASHEETEGHHRGSLRWVASRDTLPSLLEPAHPRRAFFTWLGSSEPLPELSDTPNRRRDTLRWLASRDPLPEVPQRSDRRREMPTWLFSREQLPVLPGQNHPPAPSFFRWLVTSEALEMPQSPNYQGGPRP